MAIIDIIPGLDNRNIHEVRTRGVNFNNQGGGTQGTVNIDVQDYVNNRARREAQDPTQGASSERFDPFVRDVERDELVENRLVNMLNSDSAYIRQARGAGRVAQAERGGLSGSMWAGASQAVAMQAAAPIAQADAMAYRQAASENLQAMNANILSKLQSATQIQVANIGAMAATGAARISANARVKVAEMQHDHQAAMFQLTSQHDRDMFGLGAAHDTFLENLRQDGRMQIENFLQDGRIELTNLTHGQRKELANLGFDHDVNMTNLSFEQKKEIEELFGTPRFNAEMELRRVGLRTQTTLSLYNAYNAGISSMTGADIDQAAFERGAQFYRDSFENASDAVEQLWDLDFDIDFSGGG